MVHLVLLLLSFCLFYLSPEYYQVRTLNALTALGSQVHNGASEPPPKCLLV